MIRKNFHFIFGTYGIVFAGNRLLVIKKNDGPYINRYDLPGDSLNEGESLSQTVSRAVQSQTGLKVIKAIQLGTVSFRYPWKYRNFLWNEHVCVFYQIDDYSGVPNTKTNQFVGSKLRGSEWIEIENLNLENSSPLVLKAKEFILLKKFVATDTKYDHWTVLK